MAIKDKFIPDDIPSDADYERYTKWREENEIVYIETVKVKDIKIDKRRSIMIQDFKLPGKYIECSAKLLYERFGDYHPVKSFSDDYELTFYFDGVLNPKIFENSSVIIIKDRKTKKVKVSKQMS